MTRATSRQPSNVWTRLIAPFRNRSLRAKVILTFLAVTLLSVGGITYFNNRSTITQLTGQTGQNLENLAVAEGYNMGTTIDRTVEALKSFSLGQQVRSSINRQMTAYRFEHETEAEVQEEIRELDRRWYSDYRRDNDSALMLARLNNVLAEDLRELQRAFPEFSQLMVTDQYGAIVAISEPTSDYFQADETWWQQAYNQGDGHIYIGEPKSKTDGSYPEMQVGIPIYQHGSDGIAQNGDFIGVLGVTVSTEPLAQLLQSAILGETGRAELLLGTANHTFGPIDGTYGVYTSYDQQDAEVFSRLRTESQGFIQSRLHDSDKFIAYAPVTTVDEHDFVAELDWKIVVHQEREEALALVSQTVRNTGVLAVIIAGIVVGVGVLMGQHFAGPIMTLSSAMTRFTEGDLDTRVDIETGDETGTLAQRFNEMADQVSSLLHRLERRREELERRTEQLDANQRAISVIFEASKQSKPDELLGLVVNMIRDQFALYHVQIYMVDHDEEAAILRESTGYAGRQLLRQGHRIPLDRSSLVSRAITQNEPVIVRDVEEADDFLPNPMLPDTRAELVVPLRLDDTVIGALDAQYSDPSQVNQDVVILFQTMAEQIAFLFQNSELLTQVSEQNEALTNFTTQLRTAAELGQRLTTIHDPDELLYEAVAVIQNRFGYYHVHIYLLDEDGETLVVRAGSGEVGRILDEQAYSIRIDQENNIATQAARTKSVVLVNDVSERETFQAHPLLPQTRAEVALPLVVRDEVLGVLDVQDDRRNRFSEPDVNALHTLAGQITSALHNARLFEEIQQTAERLREVDRLKSEFLANMSHELRTPLNSIIGYAEIMLMGLDGELEAEAQQDVQAIYENGQHLLTLINDILDLAKIEAGRITLDMQPIDIEDLFQEVHTSHVGILHQTNKDLKLVTDVEEDLPRVEVDYARMNQVLNNLVSNAIKFTEEGSITLRAFADDDHVYVEVEDTGVGISRADQQHIFERFRQADGSSTRLADGTGLGLAITHHLVNMHGGTISVESEPGSGSTFTVQLPRHKHNGANEADPVSEWSNDPQAPHQN